MVDDQRDELLTVTLLTTTAERACKLTAQGFWGSRRLSVGTTIRP